MLVRSLANCMKTTALNFPAPATESGWLEIAEQLLERFEQYAGWPPEIGLYWTNGSFSGPSFDCRIRSNRPLPDIESDCWDGHLGMGVGRGHLSAWILAFPFLRKARVSSEGLFSEITNDMDVNDFRGYSFDGDRWHAIGWQFGHGPGEWNHIRKPGDGYPRVLRCSVEKTNLQPNSPINMQVDLSDFVADSDDSTFPVHVTLERVGRNGAWDNLVPISRHRYFRRSQQVITLSRFTSPDAATVTVDLQRWKIKGGWRPARYSVSLCLQGLYREEGSRVSYLSDRLQFTITDLGQQ